MDNQEYNYYCKRNEHEKQWANFNHTRYAFSFNGRYYSLVKNDDGTYGHVGIETPNSTTKKVFNSLVPEDTLLPLVQEVESFLKIKTL